MRVGLHQGCPLSLILFITFTDRTSWCSQGAEEFWFGDVKMSSPLFADEVVLLTATGGDLQLALERFTAKCEAAEMRISTPKSETVLSWKRAECPAW